MNDGGPAFPRASTHSERDGLIDCAENGMTLRDWFAGQALAASPITDCSPDYLEQRANRCWRYADAMIQEREKRQ